VVWWDAVRCGAVWCGVVRWSVVWGGVVRCSWAVGMVVMVATALTGDGRDWGDGGEDLDHDNRHSTPMSPRAVLT
jgi:hypothetical protein